MSPFPELSFFLSLTSLFLLLVSGQQLPYIQIAGTLAFSSELNYESTHFSLGYRYWAESVNNDSGILIGNQRYLVNLTILDDQGLENLVTQYYTQFATQTDPPIDFLLGPYSSRLCITAIDAIRPYNMSMFIAGCSSDVVYDNASYPYIYTTNTRASHYSYQMIDMLMDKGLSSFTIIYKDDPFSIAIADGAVSRINQRGGSTVFHQKYHAGSSDELTTLILQAKAISTDVFLAMGHYTDFLLTMQLTAFMEFSPTMAGFGQGLTITPETKDVAKYWLGVEHWSPQTTSFGVSGKYLGTTTEFVANFERWRNATVDLFDATGATAPVLLQQGLELADTLDRDALYDAMHRLQAETFYGAIGLDQVGCNIAKQLLVSQFVGGEVRIVGPVQAELPMVFPSPWPWSTRYPFTEDKDLHIAVSAVAGAFMVLSLLLMAGVYIYRNEKIIRAGSWHFLEATLVGCLFLYAAVIFYAQPVNTSNCISTIWFGHVGYVLAMGGLLVKNYRIHRVYNNYTLRQLTKLDNRYLGRRLVMLATISVLLLLVWSTVDPPLPVILNSEDSQVYYEICGSRFNAKERTDGKWEISQTVNSNNLKKTNSSTTSPFTIVILIYEIIVLLYLTWLSYQVRNARAVHQESKQIALAAYNTIFIGALVGLLILVLKPNPDATLAMIGFGVLVGTTVVAGSLCAYKLMLVLFPIMEPVQTSELSGVPSTAELELEVAQYRKETEAKIKELEGTITQLRRENEIIQGEVIHLKDQVETLTREKMGGIST